MMHNYNYNFQVLYSLAFLQIWGRCCCQNNFLSKVSSLYLNTAGLTQNSIARNQIVCGQVGMGA